MDRQDAYRAFESIKGAIEFWQSEDQFSNVVVVPLAHPERSFVLSHVRWDDFGGVWLIGTPSGVADEQVTMAMWAPEAFIFQGQTSSSPIPVSFANGWPAA